MKGYSQSYKTDVKVTKKETKKIEGKIMKRNNAYGKQNYYKILK